MEFVVTQFKWIMLIGGVVTLTMLQAAIAPRAALRSLLGSGLIDHSQKMTVAAMVMADMKVWAQRS